ncbi:hypothetical protein FSP39_010321 [Pinctada imbricata]|uniref:Serine/threonine-protein kinase 11-interacting protein n=1 Tax=Pinctada imbricata TaxID=66713 RepID=A0AA88YIV8_PINIB|nr:hypothetical protein FSP39_010321 [Pinctada imbricata]
MNIAFRRYSDTSGNNWDVPHQRRDARRRHIQQEWRTNVQYVHDFIVKAISLKVTHGSHTMQGPILISRFRSLRELELRKIPMHMLEGLHRLRGQLKVIVAGRCLQNIQDLLETCGGDQSSPMSWPNLTALYLSYNDIIRLDPSLRLAPNLEVLDLSHNSIQKVENYLEYLTQLCRINLGYNFLDTIPVFALSARSKLQTLIIRNNNLDNIEGVSELVNLEEVDVSENCLCDHACLEPLSAIHKLKMAHFHVIIFVDVTQNILKMALSSFNLYYFSFAESDNIATSVKVGSPSKRKVKKKRGRSRSRQVDDVDSGLCQSYNSATDVSPESSRVPSPERVVEGQASIRSTKEEIEVIRDHYGVNWLQVIANRNSTDRLSNESSSPKASPKNVSEITTAVVHNVTIKTEDDLYLNESEAGIHGNSTNGSHDTEDDIVVLKEPEKVDNKDPTIPASTSGEFYGVLSPGSDNSERSFHRMHSSKGAEWERTSEEQELFYGAESEPLIVMLLNEDLRQLFVSTNQRYLIEKDYEGHVIEMLDLKCLLVCNRKQEEIIHANLADGTWLPVIRLKFDYVKKDRRERVYVMESSQCADDFEELISPFLQVRELEDRMKGMLQCLKCSAQFTKDKAIQKPKITQTSVYEPNSDAEKYSCPKCSSDMVLELDIQQKPDSRQCTPVGSLPKALIDIGHYSPTQLASSPVAKSTPNKVPDQLTSHNDIASSPARRRSNAFSESMTRSDNVKSNIPEQILPKSFSTGHNMDGLKDTQSNITPGDPEGFHRELSWSDVRQSIKQGTSRLNSTESDITIITDESRKDGSKRQSLIGSIESDISILTSDSSSIAVLSSNSNGVEQSIGGKTDAPVSQENLDIPNSSSMRVSVPPGGLLLKGISEEGDTTPYGSPLSNSVCSSMVSSVYENSLVANSNESLTTENSQRKDSVLSNSHREDTQNNNHGDVSIYDSTSIYDNDADGGDTIYSTNESKDGYLSMGNSTNENGTASLTNVSNTQKKSDHSQTLEERSTADLTSFNSESSLTVLDAITNGTWLTSHDQSHDQSCDLDFTKIDHKLKLYLVMHVLEEDDEEIQFAVQCDVVQYMKPDFYPGYLVFSSHRVLVLELTHAREKEEPELTCVENQPITELQYIDIGLGYQSLRFEFSTECSSYTFCIRDEARCKQIIKTITNIVQDTTLSNDSKLEGISKYNAVTMGNLQDVVWSPWKQDLTEEEDHFSLVKYLSGHQLDEELKESQPVGIAIMTEDLCLVTVNHQWPLPRLQAPLSDEVKGQQFSLIDHQRINNIATVEVCEETGSFIRITFFSEESQNEATWFIAMATTNGVKSLINSVKGTWEEEFGVELDIAPVSFGNLDFVALPS